MMMMKHERQDKEMVGLQIGIQQQEQEQLY
jgi:hypothetical protein